MLSLLVTSLLWAFSFGLIKRYLAGVDPSFVAFARLGLAFAVFLPWLRPRKLGPRGVAELGLLGALQFGSMYLLYLWAFRSLQAYQVALLTITTPIWVCLSENVLCRRLTLRPLVAALLAMTGAAVVTGANGFGRAPWHGIVLIQASNACFALGQILFRRVRQRHLDVTERALFGWMYLGAVVVTLPFTAGHISSALAHLTSTECAVLFYLGCVASGLGFFLWNDGALRVPTALLAVMNDVKIPLGVLVSLVCFGETVQFVRLLFGGALMLVAAEYARRHTAP